MLQSNGHLKDPKKKETLSSIISSFAETTSLQGPPFIKRADHWYSKTAWILFLISAFAIATLHCYYVCMQYYSYDTNTKISLGYKSLPYPSISVCNINPIRMSQIKLASKELQDFINDLVPQTEFKLYRPKVGDLPSNVPDNDDIPKPGVGQPEGNLGNIPSANSKTFIRKKVGILIMNIIMFYFEFLDLS